MRSALKAALAALVLFAGATAALPGTAYAQGRCQGAGTAGVQAIPPPPDPGANEAYIGLLSRVLYPEEPQTITREIPCRRGRPFEAGGTTYTLTGGDEDVPSRRAVGANPADPIYWIESDLDPNQLLQGLIGAASGGSNVITVSFRYVLMRSEGDRLTMLRVYSGVPQDDVLRRDIAAFANGEAVGEATVGDQPGTVEILTATTPPPGTAAPGGGSRLSRADGQIFASLANGAAQHRATGFICPRTLAGVRRRDLIIYDPSAGGRDVGCGYGAPGSEAWYTIYLTHAPEVSHSEVFDIYLEQAQSLLPPTRQALSPLMTGDAPRPTSATFWVNQTGQVEGLALASKDGWHFKLRVTFVQGQEEDVQRFSNGVFGAFFGESLNPITDDLAAAD